MINFLNKLDVNLFLWMNGAHAPFLDRIMVLLSGQFVWIPMIVFFIWKSKENKNKRSFALLILFMFLALALSDVTSSYILKNIATRLRPCRLDELKPMIYQFGQKCGGKFGFVSSHAANSVALIMFSLQTLKLSPKFHLLWILPVLVSISRIYLGVHYPGDILGGAAVGFFWGICLSEMYKKT